LEETMDPSTCYLEIMEAMDHGELQLARELALALRHWFDSGGFYPAPAVRSSMDAYLQGVLDRTEHLP